MFLGSQTQILYPCIRRHNENFASTTHKVHHFAIDLLARRIRGRWEVTVVLKTKPHCKKASSKKGVARFSHALKSKQFSWWKKNSLMSPSFQLSLILQKKHLAFLALYIICFFFSHCTCWLNEGKFKFNREVKAPSTLATPEKWTTFSLWKCISCFPFTLRRRNIKNETITGPDCVWRGLGQGNHLNITSSSIFGMLRFQKVFRPHNAKRVFWNSSGS